MLKKNCVPIGSYSISEKASTDIEGIYEYGILNFGLAQAQEYVLGLHDCCQVLADNPALGRYADQLVPQLRRHEYRSDVVFYMEQGNGVFIIRVLGSSMDIKQHIKSKN